MNKPHSKHAPAIKKRNLTAGVVRSYKCVHLSRSIVLWTVREHCDLVGFPSHLLPSSCPREITLQPQVLVLDLWTFFSAYNTWAESILSCPSKLDQVSLPPESQPHPISLSLGSHCTFCLFPLQHLSHTEPRLFLCLSFFLTLCLLFLTNHSAQFQAQTKQC